MPNLEEASRDPIMVLHQMAAPRHPPNMIFQKDKMEFRFLDKMKFRFLDKMKFRFLDKKEFRFLDEMEFIFVDKMRFIFSYKIELIIYVNVDMILFIFPNKKIDVTIVVLHQMPAVERQANLILGEDKIGFIFLDCRGNTPGGKSTSTAGPGTGQKNKKKQKNFNLFATLQEQLNDYSMPS